MAEAPVSTTNYTVKKSEPNGNWKENRAKTIIH